MSLRGLGFNAVATFWITLKIRERLGRHQGLHGCSAKRSGQRDLRHVGDVAGVGVGWGSLLGTLVTVARYFPNVSPRRGISSWALRVPFR